MPVKMSLSVSPGMDNQLASAAAAVAGGVMLLWAAPAAAGGAATDPAMVLGPDTCGECHKEEVEVWRETHHAKTFTTMPREDKAREIADKLGLRRIKDESVCLSCHFTEAVSDGETKAIAGISCESCHGAAKDWNDPHSDFGGKDVTAESETPEHKAERLATVEAAGLIRPLWIVDWASNCYGCHTVPEEKLVNEGGHPAGSAFELVAWSQGEVRHNIWFSEGKANREATDARKRVMYVVGRALDLTFALRGVAKATANADYAKAMAKRAKTAAQRLQQIGKAASIAEVDAMLAVAGSVKLKLNNADALNAAADEIEAAARQFAESNDGADLAGLDALLPAPESYKGKPAR